MRIPPGIVVVILMLFVAGPVFFTTLAEPMEQGAESKPDGRLSQALPLSQPMDLTALAPRTQGSPLSSLESGLLQKDPNPPGDDNTGCAESCGKTCQDGGTCEISCGTGFCAACSCPTSCTCKPQT